MMYSGIIDAALEGLMCSKLPLVLSLEKYRIERMDENELLITDFIRGMY